MANNSRAAITASPGQQPQQQHGTKRPADTTLQNEQRLSKRFDLLNIDSNGQRLYIPVSSSSDALRQPPKPVLLPTDRKEKRKLRIPPDGDSLMEVEDSPHKVYIHDLAAELSDVESDDEHPVFLSDIEKHLSKIPAFILASPEPKSTRDNQIVLYNVPSSLSVPEEKDSVRKAIVEARARMREKQGSTVQEPALHEVNSKMNGKEEKMSATEEDDPDAMEID
ncbi:uncharacterized protein BDZ99DRAFT_464425 [Mytilinidion resinicola]|uniref:Uncharacterized protein n=1 Tax=Mytilinidion resinicola TaxID=574789 RepID=A0A6A6YID2_9PEZI|nr:uncharacterized protein BDZ99DRAFT_464425 [Mytilinidion resinicola]KAF2808561.1 hypothetical protein BDZ99DRAFT_464425 [Mytilinidion resinicola]